MPELQNANLYGDVNHTQLKNAVHTAPRRLKVDDVVDGTVVSIKKSAIYVDLGIHGVGIIYGAEFIQARDVIKKINVGDAIKSKVIETENDNGHVELSLKEAKQAAMWSDAEEAIKSKAVFDLVIKEANKGGLILDWQGV